MKVIVAVAAGLVALAGCSQPAPAPATTTATATATAASIAQAGVWIFDSTPPAATPCVMKLDDNVNTDAPKVHDAWLAGGCEGTFTFLGVLSGWEELDNGGVRLIGAEGEPIGDFTAGADGVLRAVVNNDNRPYTLRRPAA